MSNFMSTTLAPETRVFLALGAGMVALLAS